MPTVNEYEIELRVTNTNKKEDQLVKRTEWAYSVMDALYQATVKEASKPQFGSSSIVVTSVGPPSRFIEEANSAVSSSIKALLRRAKSQM